MAINLNPGADATLVAQSYRMGMAGVPKDLSKTFEAVATSYGDAMTKVGAAAKEVAGVVGKVAAIAVKDALRIQDSYAAGTNLTQEGVEGFVTQEIFDVKSDLDAARKLTPFSTERRAAKMKAKKRQNDLFAQIKNLEDGVGFNVKTFADGLYDKDATGIEDLTQAHAISLRGEPIKDGDFKGYYSKLGKNENGDLAWVFTSPEGSAVSQVLPSGEVILADGVEAMPLSVGSDGIKNLLKPDAIEGQTALNTIDQTNYDSGVKGVLARRNIVEGNINKVITEGNISSLMHKDVGNMDNTFMQDLDNPSSLSASVFAELQDIGLEDIDGGGIGAGDFADSNGDNYGILKSALTNPKDPNYSFATTKEVFSSWYTDSVMESNKTQVTAYNKKQKNLPSLTSAKENTIAQFEKGDKIIKLDQYNTAVRQDDGTYVTVKNSEVGLDASGLTSFSVDDYIKSLGGNVKTPGPKSTGYKGAGVVAPGYTINSEGNVVEIKSFK